MTGGVGPHSGMHVLGRPAGTGGLCGVPFSLTQLGDGLNKRDKPGHQRDLS
jgi:hypothetical protein